MPKKIFDIAPPQEEKEHSVPIKVFSSKREHKPEIKEHAVLSFSSEKKRKNFKPLFATLLAVILILIGAWAVNFFFLENVKIEVWPKSDVLNIEKEITVDIDDKSDPSLWLEKGVIPGEIVSNQKEETQEFPASGKAVKQEKASGVIKIYNNYSQSAQSLVANTRFVSADGKLFRSVKKVSIPGGTYDNKGKFVPGEIDVEVVAAESGEDYNIAPSTFSIPGFAGTSKYTAFYGKSFSNMSGGFEGEVAQITQSDMDNAEGILIDKLEKDIKDLLTKNLPNGYVLLNEAIFNKVTDKDFSAGKGAEADSFTLQVKMDSNAIIFKRADVEKIVKAVIGSNIDKGQNFQEDKIEINYSFKSLGFEERIAEEEVRDKKLKKLNIGIGVVSKIYQNIDLDEIKKTVLGKSFYEIETFLGDRSDISKVRIEPGFFGRSAAPDDLNRVKLDLKLD